MPRAAIAVVAAAALLFAPQSTFAHSGLTLRGSGTATVNGVLAPGEWVTAGHYDFNAALPAEEGGGTVPATLYMMSDAQFLYIAVRIGSASISGTTSFFGAFDNNHSGTLYEEGDEMLEFERSGGTTVFYDGFIHLIPRGFCGCFDAEFGGTTELASGYTRDALASYYEFSHPLNTADDAHDFSLGPGRRVGLGFDFAHCGPTQCASTRAPPIIDGAPPDFVVVSTDHTPPNTQITAGPAERSIVAPAEFDFTFTGTDAAIPPDTLLYECKLDAGTYAPCTSPHRLLFVDDGPHVFSVRALDDWDLADPSPAERRWSVDGDPPTRPRVIGPRVTRKRSPTFRFSATDAVTPAKQIRYRCAFDRRRLHACGRRYSQRLSRGRHALRVRALDILGNRSTLTTVRVVVKKSRR